MRVVRIIAYVIGALVALVVVALLLVAAFVNPNAYKGRIIREVKAATGRDLALPGDIHLSVFPWVALKLGPASLGNPQGFPDDRFVSFRQANLRVRVLPLLHGELEVGKITLDGLDLNLEKNAAGKGNWEDFGHSAATPAPQAAPSATAPTSLRSLGGVEITASRMRYGDVVLQDLNVSIGAASGSATVPVQFGFEIRRGTQAAPIKVSASMQALIDVADKRYGIHDLSMSGELGKTAGRAAVAWKFASPAVDVDLAAQTLKAPAFTAAFANANLSGSLEGARITDAPEFSGALRLETLAPRDFMTQLGMTPPVLRDPHALASLAFSSRYRYGANAAHLDQLQARLDESTLQGSLAVTNLDTDALSFELRLDQIDLDRYRAPPTAAAPAAAPRTAGGSAPAELPTAPVRALDAQGSVAIGRAKVAGLTLTDASATLADHGGVLKLASLKARLYGGEYAGAITYDAHTDVPALTLRQELSGVDMGALLKDAVGTQRLSGRGNGTIDLDGQGTTSDALLRSLTGQLGFNLDKGAVEGLDLWYAIGAAQSLLQQRTLPATANTQRTQFDVMKVSATVSGGIATTHDLTLSSPYLRLTGQGTANLASKALNLHLVTTLLKSPPGAQDTPLSALTLADIPVDVGGTLTSPSVRPDVQGLVKSAIRNKAQDLIKDKLKGLFGK
ncbi:MAG TPA: AsmA family protein [Steroidobacteraceae bacterium]|nr:AsmA family protein [Steroidobacteraceae bacterium]